MALVCRPCLPEAAGLSANPTFPNLENYRQFPQSLRNRAICPGGGTGARGDGVLYRQSEQFLKPSSREGGER